MYKIIGADKQEYGPLSSDFVRAWIKNGRLGRDSLIRREGTPDWVRLDSLPEFGLALASLPAPPPVVSTAPRPKTCGMAIASLVLGILGGCGLTALAGFILGFIALGKIKNSEGKMGGRGLAITGIVVSAVFLVLLTIAAVKVAPFVAQARQQIKADECRRNLSELHPAMYAYADANEGKFPSADSWCDAIKDKAPAGAFLCPVGDPKKRCHFAFNTKLGGVETSKIQSPAETVMFFETTGGWNVNGGIESLARPPRHRRSYIVCLANGSVRQMGAARLRQMRWDP